MLSSRYNLLVLPKGVTIPDALVDGASLWVYRHEEEQKWEVARTRLADSSSCRVSTEELLSLINGNTGLPAIEAPPPPPGDVGRYAAYIVARGGTSNENWAYMVGTPSFDKALEYFDRYCRDTRSPEHTRVVLQGYEAHEDSTTRGVLLWFHRDTGQLGGAQVRSYEGWLVRNEKQPPTQYEDVVEAEPPDEEDEPDQESEEEGMYELEDFTSFIIGISDAVSDDPTDPDIDRWLVAISTGTLDAAFKTFAHYQKDERAKNSFVVLVGSADDERDLNSFAENDQHLWWDPATKAMHPNSGRALQEAYAAWLERNKPAEKKPEYRVMVVGTHDGGICFARFALTSHDRKTALDQAIWLAHKSQAEIEHAVPAIKALKSDRKALSVQVNCVGDALTNSTLLTLPIV